MNIAEKYMTDMELNEPSNPLEINKTEDKLKIKFPEQYKKFLLSHNGAEGSIGENSYLVIWIICVYRSFIRVKDHFRTLLPPDFSIHSISFYAYVFISGYAIV